MVRIRNRCRWATCSVLVVGALLGLPDRAAGQPGQTPPAARVPGAPVYAAPPPPPAYGPPPTHAAPPPACACPPRQPAPPSSPRWGIGFHIGGMGVESEREDDDGEGDDARETRLGLIGAQLRFRLHRRWELELGGTYMEGELPGPGRMMRTSGAITLGAMFHLNPDSRWLWSVLAGVGGTRDRIWYRKDGDRVITAEFVEGLIRVGGSLERRFDHWGLAAQLYGVALERDDEELDGPDYIGRDGPVPEQSVGALLQIAANYYF